MRTLIVCTLLGGLGCQGGEVLSPVEDVEVVPPAAEPDFLPFDCGAIPVATASAERALLPGRVRTVGLGPCGHLSWLDTAGDYYLADPSLDDAMRLAGPVTSAQHSRRADQVLVTDADGWTWIDPADGSTFSFEASRAGLLRDGEGELAWACVGTELGTVDADGFHPRVSEVRLCDRVWPAAEAPRIAFVGPDFLLRVIDLSEDDGRVFDLGEVPYIAASNDGVQLSVDGRILFHQPGSVFNGRVGIFDLARPAGDRLIGAPRIQGGFSYIVRASGSGHAAGMQAEEGAVMLSEEGLLHLYEDTTFLSIAPEGDRALFMAEGPVRGQPWDVFVGRPMRTREVVETLPGPLTSHARSSRSGAFVSWGPATGPSSGAFFVSWRWSTERLTELPDQPRSPRWVGDDGAHVTDYDGEVVLRGPDGEELHHWPLGWGPFVRDAGEDALVWLRGPEGQALVVASTTSAREATLYEGEAGLNGALVDGTGDRFVYWRVEPNPDDMTMVQTRIVAGAIPR